MSRGVPPRTGGLLTVEEFARLPEEEGRSELVRGRLVREPPAGFEHGEVAARVAHRLREFVVRQGLGRVVGAETGFVLSEDPPTVRAPDAAFVAAERVPAAPEGFAALAPDLAVEVVSPSNAIGATHQKARDYLAAGTRMVWVIEPRSRSVTVYRPDGVVRRLGPDDALEGADVLPGFRLPVARLFAD